MSPDPQPAATRDPSANDRRQDLRRPLVVLRVHGEGGPDTLLGYAKNLGSGGMAVSTINSPEVGTRLTARFALPAPLGFQVRCDCEVVWVRPFTRENRIDPGMGLRFLELPKETAAAIAYWVHSETDRRRVHPRRRLGFRPYRAA